MSELLKLAERCEAATADEQAELIHEAFDAVFPKPTKVWVTDNTGSWTPEYAAYHELSWRFVELLEAGASLDSAMSLVPEGCAFLVRQSTESDELTNGKPLGVALANVHPLNDMWSRGGEHVQWISWAATPALALCAASLRARAAGEGK